METMTPHPSLKVKGQPNIMNLDNNNSITKD
jgi:hypothetical protein